MNLVDLLRAFGADEDLITLAERWVGRADDGVDQLTDDELGALLSGLIALGEIDEVGDGLIAAAADTAVEIRGEQTVREAEAATAEAERAANQARLRGEEVDGEVDDPNAAPGDGDDDGDDGGDGGGDADGGDGAGDGETAPATAEGEPVMAGAGRSGRADIGALARRRPRAAAPNIDETPRATLVYAADVPGVSAGAEVPADRLHLDRVSDAMQRRFQSFRRSSRSGVEEMIPVATLRSVYPEDRRLIDDSGELLSALQMSRIVGRVLEREVNPETIAAAGGLCAPLQPYYGVEVVGDTYRPIRDEALVSFQASRGGLISMAPPILPSLAGSIGVWTMADDVTAASDPSHHKAIIDVVCGTTRTTQIRAITARLRYGNIISRTFGEWTQAWADLQMVAQARVAEIQLLADIKAASTILALQTTHVSATRDTLNLLNRIAARVRSTRRVRPDGLPMRVILPEVWLGIAVEDIANALPGISVDDNLAIATARIMNFFRARNLNVTFTPDLNMMGEQGGTGGSPGHPADWPPAIDFAIYPEGTFLHVDNGEIDFGVVRDTTTNAVNNFETFSESFEAAHKLGNDATWGTLNVCPSGAVRGTLDPAGVCASYT